MMSENSKTSAHISVRVMDAVVPAIYKESAIAIAIFPQPVPPPTDRPGDAPSYSSEAVLKYSVKGLDLDNLEGMEFLMALFERMHEELRARALDILVNEQSRRQVPPPSEN